MPTRVQDELKAKKDVLNSDIVGLNTRKEHGLLSDQQEKELGIFKKQRKTRKAIEVENLGSRETKKVSSREEEDN